MNVISQPPSWNSAHRPIEYTLGFYTLSALSVLDDGGFVSLFFVSAPITKFVVGDYVYMTNTSLGLAKITSVTSPNLITTDKDFSDYTGGGTSVKAIVIPEIRVYKGYYNLEPYEAQLPFELIASFRPQMTLDFDIQIDISGYLKSIFRIVAPTEGIDFNMFNQFRISRYYTPAQMSSGNDLELFTSPKKVINSAIKTDDLNADYVNTGRYLQKPGSALIFSCGKTILTKVTESFVTNEVIEEGVFTGGYNEDYNNDYDKYNG